MGKRGPNASSLAGRISAFFERNPEEWLTYDDIAIKFDCTVDQARGAIQSLKYVHGKRFESAYVVRVATC